MPILLPILVSCSSSSARDKNYDSSVGQDFMPDLNAGGAGGGGGDSGAAGTGAAGSAGTAGTSGAAGASGGSDGTAGAAGGAGQGGAAGAPSGGGGSAGGAGSSGATLGALRATSGRFAATPVENEWTELPRPRKIPPHHDGRTPRPVQVHTES